MLSSCLDPKRKKGRERLKRETHRGFAEFVCRAQEEKAESTTRGKTPRTFAEVDCAPKEEEQEAPTHAKALRGFDDTPPSAVCAKTGRFLAVFTARPVGDAIASQETLCAAEILRNSFSERADGRQNSRIFLPKWSWKPLQHPRPDTARKRFRVFLKFKRTRAAERKLGPQPPRKRLGALLNSPQRPPEKRKGARLAQKRRRGFAEFLCKTTRGECRERG